MKKNISNRAVKKHFKNKEQSSEWINFTGDFPPCGLYHIKIANKELKGLVSVVNTYEGDDTSAKIHGFAVSTLTEHEEDLRECSGWVTREQFYMISGVTHYKRTTANDLKNGLQMVRRINNEFVILPSEPF